MKKLYKIHEFVPENAKQSYLDGWAVRRMLRFAFRRQKDCVRRGQNPREPRFSLIVVFLCDLFLGKHFSRPTKRPGFSFLKFKHLGIWVHTIYIFLKASQLRMKESDPCSARSPNLEWKPLLPRDTAPRLDPLMTWSGIKWKTK